MSDGPERSDEIPDEATSAETTPQPARRPSPTSRARRIGGRPSPAGARPSPGPSGDTDVTATRPAPSVVTTKASPRPTPPAGSELDAGPEADASDEPSTGSGWQRWIPAGILGVAALALLVMVVIASHGVYWAKPDDSSAARAAKQEQVLAAAKKCFATVNTYDYRKLGGLVAQGKPCTTGKFQSDFTEALQKTIIPQAPKAKAVQTAQVNKAGVVSISPDGKQVVTLIYGQLVVTNSTTAKSSPRTDLFGAVVTMDKVGDSWKISKVGFDAGNGLGG